MDLIDGTSVQWIEVKCIDFTHSSDRVALSHWHNFRSPSLHTKLKVIYFIENPMITESQELINRII